MHRFSAHNTLAWIAGVAGLLAVVGLQVGFFHGVVGAVILSAAAVAGAYWIYQQVERRVHSRHVAEFAALHGWAYREHSVGETAGLTDFPFGQGANRRIEDLVEGNYAGMPCVHYTYRYEHRVGDERAAELVFSVTQVTVETPLARLDLVPEDAGSRVLGAMTGTDINLESAEFNRTWRVLCRDRRYAVDVVDPRMMELLLRHRLPGVAIRIDGNKVIAWSAGRAQTGSFAGRLNLVTGVAKRVPAHVVRRFADADRKRREEEAARWAAAPDWAKTPGVLNSRRYTGIGTDADGDGVEDWEQRKR